MKVIYKLRELQTIGDRVVALLVCDLGLISLARCKEGYLNCQPLGNLHFYSALQAVPGWRPSDLTVKAECCAVS